MLENQPDIEKPLVDADKCWYALYTKSRHEKKTAELLVEKEITTFLPIIKTLRQWSDRKKYVQVPLFNSYIFIEINYKDRQRVLETDGVVCFVRTGNQPSVVPVNEINAMKAYVNQASEKNINYEIEAGHTVRIIRGPMKGLLGEVTKVNGAQKIRIKIEAINQFLNLTVPASLVEPVR